MNSILKKILFFLYFSNIIWSLLAQSQIIRLDSSQVFNKLLYYPTSRSGTDFTYDSTHNCYYYSAGVIREIHPNVYIQGVMFVKIDLLGNPLDSTIAVDFSGTIYNISHGSILITSDSCLFLSTSLNDSLYLTKTTLDFDTLWQKRYYHCFIGDALLTKDNSIVYAGCVYDTAYVRDYRRGLIFKVDSSGNEVWHRYIGVHSDGNTFKSLTKTYDGSYIAGGISYKYTFGDLYMARVDSAGNFTWEWRFVHPNFWDDNYNFSIVGIVPQKDSTFIAIGSYGNDHENSYYAMRFIKFDINKQTILDTVYELDRVYSNRYYYHDYQMSVPGLQPDTSVYENLPVYATGLKDGSIIVSNWVSSIQDSPDFSVSKIYKISPAGKIIWGRQLRAIPFSHGAYEVIYDIIPMPDNGFTTFGFIYGYSAFVYPWGQYLWLVHTDSLGCDGFGSCDTNICVTFTPPLPDTMCVTDTFYTTAKLTGTNYSGKFNFILFYENIDTANNWHVIRDTLIFTNIDTLTDIPLEITYHNLSPQLIKYELVASDTAFHENLLSAKDTTLLSGFTASHMPVYSPFPSHIIYFIMPADTNNIVTLPLNNALSIYPNPANDNLIISVNNLQLTINNVSIIDITGKQVMPSLRFRQKSEEAISTNNEQITSSQTPHNEGHLIKINIETLPAGLYFVKIKTNNGEIIRKFVKQ